MKLRKSALSVIISGIILSGTNVYANVIAKSPTAENQSSKLLVVNNAEDIVASVIDFNDGNLDVIESHNGSEIELVERNSKKILQVNSSVGPTFPGVVFSAPEPWDWSEYGDIALGIDLAYTGEKPTQLYIRVDDGVNPNGSIRSRTGYVQLSPNDKGMYYFTLKSLDKHFNEGMRGMPPRKPGQAQQIGFAWGETELDISNITSVRLYQYSPQNEASFEISSMSILPNLAVNTKRFENVVDQYGQYTGSDWKEKVHSDKQLQQRAKEDLKLVKNVKLMSDRSKFGGWKKGPKVENTGYFRTQKIDGKWALVDPEGYLYFATGLDNIRLNDTYTTTGIAFANYEEPQTSNASPSEISSLPYLERKGERVNKAELRHNMFSWLPDYNDSLSQSYQYSDMIHDGPLNHGEVFSFYAANLQRKFAPDSFSDAVKTWQDVVLSRMMDWGFTSLGNWSDTEYYSNTKVPYTAHGWIVGDHQRIPTDNDFWGAMHDPFDPQFQLSVRSMAKDIAKDVADSPWCIGIFVENELSWGKKGTEAGHYLITIGMLRLDAKQSSAKAAYMTALESKYSDIKALNSAWDTQFSSWEELAGGFNFNGEYTDTIKEDFSLFLTMHANTFFNIVDKELNAVLPNHLFLGSRFADWGLTPESVTAASHYVDVMSFNHYAYDLESKGDWSKLAEYDLPAFIGEFSFGAMDSGMFHPGGINGESQQWRADMFKHYMKSIANNPYFVGAHWFQYLDSPVTGRAWDGENYNNGFVTITDTPYQELVDAAKEFHTSLYERRYGDLN
ncbi:beta-galactosidase [Vibrio sp. 10N.286.49.F3]|uniref:beta-galactosidase n=1 Tax=unclassified Vibrio TaxID=2614977 RepID=UPI00354E9AFE